MPAFDENGRSVEAQTIAQQGQEESSSARDPARFLPLIADEEQRQFREHLLVALHRIATAIELLERR